MENTTYFTAADFVKMLFETLSLVGQPAELDKPQENPPRDLRIQTLQKAAEIWGENATLSKIAKGENFDNPIKQKQRENLLKEEFIPNSYPRNPWPNRYVADLKSTTDTLLNFRRALSEPKNLLDGILCGGGLSKVMEYIQTETEKLNPTLQEVDRLLGRLLFPQASPIPTEQLPTLATIKEADYAWL
jgi:hypothetical protein